jgi:signal transduction histidine kinase/CheY-like chemotaxis protein
MVLRAGPARSADVRAELSGVLAELRQQNVGPLLAVQFGLALALVSAASLFRDPLHGGVPALMLAALVPAVWWARRLSPRLAAWLLVCGWIAAVLVFVAWVGLDLAVCLLAIPVGVAALTISVAGGVAAAALCTALLAWPAAAALSVPLRVVALLGMWGTVGLIALALRPLMTALEWSWASYEQSRRALEQALDAQLELRRTLADLADANEQLTRLNRLAHGLREAAEEARQAKERFVAVVSHELRTPLNMILGFGEMILKAPETYGRKLPAALLADLAVIVRNSQHLANLVDDVLDLSQIDARRVALTREWVTLKEIIEAAATVVRPLFDSKHLYLELDVPEDTAVFCDRTRIREVVINLLSNAGRFTERGGVRVRVWREDNSYFVSVADTGPGIAEQDQERLFRPFEQLDGSIRRRYGGAGLGLSISKAFVELHGGHIWVESSVGQGTVFTFRLPAQPPETAEPGVSRWFSPYWHYEKPVRRSAAPPATLRPRFVVLEQGESLQRLLARYVYGAEIVPVADYDAALRELNALPAQALLINRLSAGDALERLRSAANLPYGTPALICALPGLADAANALGVADYLVKPVTREALLAALDRHAAPKATVLVVDDEPDAVQLFWRTLMSAGRGYRVLTAGSGREALEMLRAERPDVILLDLIMEDISGFEVIEACGREPAWRSIPIIVLSARDPSSEPIVSDALTVTCRGGLSVPHLLASIEALSRVLSVCGPAAVPASAAAQPG